MYERINYKEIQEELTYKVRKFLVGCILRQHSNTRCHLFFLLRERGSLEVRNRRRLLGWNEFRLAHSVCVILNPSRQKQRFTA